MEKEEFCLSSSTLAEYAFDTQVSDVSIVSQPKYSIPSPLLNVQALQLIKEVFLESKQFDVSLTKALNNRQKNRELSISNPKQAPEWKQKNTAAENLHLQRPLLLAEPDSLDLSLTENANLLADFSSSCSYQMDAYLSLETLCQTFAFGSETIGDRAAVGVPRLHSPHLHLIIEPLSLRNYHLFVSGEPVPAHLVTLCLFAFHTFTLRRESPVIYIPTLESGNDAKYMASLLRSISRHCPSPFPIRCVIAVDNVFGALQLDWIAHALEETLAGVVLQTELCRLSWEEFSSQQVDTKEFDKRVREHVQEICRRTGILPVAAGDFSFASSAVFSVVPSPSEVAEFGELVRRESQQQSSQGWLSVVLLNPQALPYVFQTEHKSHKGFSSNGESLREYLSNKSVHSTPVPLDFRFIEDEFLFCLQYLTLFIGGKARFSYDSPAMKKIVLTDANVFEAHRRQLQRWVSNGRTITLKSGEKKPFDVHTATELLSEVFHRICHGVGAVQVFRSLETKIAYDDSFHLLKGFIRQAAQREQIQHFSASTYWHMIAPFINNPGRLQRFLLADKLPFLWHPNVCIDGQIVFTTNESFAPAKSLCKAEFPSFRPKSFGPQGQVFDGWETRRHNMFPPDYTVIKLKKACKIHGVNIDTAHFSGNAGQGASLLGLVITLRHNRYQEEWVSLLDPVILEENSRNYFATKQQPLVQYVRLNQYPDGGIARLELFGETVETTVQQQLAEHHDKLWHEKVKEYFSLLPKETGFPSDFEPPYSDASLLGKPDVSLPCSSEPPTILFPSLHDFGGAEAAVVAGSNTQYSIPGNILRPGRGINMGDGWETARMHVPSKDVFNLTTAVTQLCNWTVIRLNQKGKLQKIVVDTFHFKNNTPKAFALEGTDHPHLTLDNYYDPSVRWCSILPPTGLIPHKEQLFDVPVEQQNKSWTHVLIKIYPCGGLSRVRLYGPVEASSSL